MKAYFVLFLCWFACLVSAQTKRSGGEAPLVKNQIIVSGSPRLIGGGYRPSASDLYAGHTAFIDGLRPVGSYHTSISLAYSGRQHKVWGYRVLLGVNFHQPHYRDEPKVGDVFIAAGPKIIYFRNSRVNSYVSAEGGMGWGMKLQTGPNFYGYLNTAFMAIDIHPRSKPFVNISFSFLELGVYWPLNYSWGVTFNPIRFGLGFGF